MMSSTKLSRLLRSEVIDSLRTVQLIPSRSDNRLLKQKFSKHDAILFQTNLS